LTNHAAQVGGVRFVQSRSPAEAAKKETCFMNLFGFDIRPATTADFPQLCRLFAEIDALHRRARPELFRPPQEPIRDSGEIEQLIAGPDSAILVAEDATLRHVVGLAVVAIRETPGTYHRPAQRFPELDTLVVHKYAQRQGVGRMLVRAAREWSAERGFASIELTVHEFNAAAQAFYAAVGFRTATRRLAASVLS
jgi:ribosomal protein S18 acetylase RimI-like enzyme